MRITHIIATICLLFLLSACGPRSLKGTYTCQENPEENTGLFGGFLGDCVFGEIEFINEKTATIDLLGTKVAVEYEIERNLLTLDTNQGRMLFEIQDSRTLVGKAPTEGIFKK